MLCLAGKSHRFLFNSVDPHRNSHPMSEQMSPFQKGSQPGELSSIPEKNGDACCVFLLACLGDGAEAGGPPWDYRSYALWNLGEAAPLRS